VENNYSKIEELMMQIAEWKAKFSVEREWKGQLEKEKKEIEEKYSQVIYELGSNKRLIEQLEEKVKLLSSGFSNGVGSDVAPLQGKEEHAVKPEEGREEAKENQKQEKEEKESEGASVPIEEKRTPFHHVPHHVYTNPDIYEPISEMYYQRRPMRTFGSETPPHIIYRHDPDFYVQEPPIDARRPQNDLDEVVEEITETRE